VSSVRLNCENMSGNEFNRLATVSYISLTTFRRTGKPVSTPVWGVQFEDGIGVITAGNSGKIKRLRHTSRVLIAEADQSGGLLGEPVLASARICVPEQVPLLRREIAKKYGWQARALSILQICTRLIRRKVFDDSVALIITQE
jgi:PPOX class probable F420-dependent enzyme